VIAAVLAAAIQIRATEYAFSLPAQIASGTSTFAFENAGREPHDLRFVQIAAGHTMDEFVAWQKTDAPIPDWLVSSGGIGAVAPGRTEEYTASLAAGAYVVICTYPAPDGASHLRKGMYAALRVGPETSTDRPPAEDITITLHDHGFQLNAPVTGGKPVWRIHNNGTEPHQLLLVRLPDGVTEWNERLWFNNGARGERRGVPEGGVVEVLPDGDAWFRVEMSAGRYVLLCTMLEQEGRHFDLGMIYRFTIE
jgi:hypothetical protein